LFGSTGISRLKEEGGPDSVVTDKPPSDSSWAA